MAKQKRNKRPRLKHGTRDYGKPKDSVTLASPTQWDRGPDTPAQRDGKVVEPRGDVDPITGKVVNPNGVRGARRKPWIERYRDQGRITVEQFFAGKMLYEAHQGEVARDPLMAIGEVRAPGGGDPHAANIDRKQKFFAVWRAVPEEYRPVLNRVVIEDLPVATATDGIHWRDRKQQMGYLREALDIVAEAI